MLALSRPRVRWFQAGTINLVVDGNSIPAGGQDGSESIGGLTGYMKRNVAPFTGQGHVNVAIGGQKTSDMLANHSDVDAAWVAGMTNVLYVQEGTNSNGDDAGITASQNVQLMLDYLATVKAARVWDAVIVATASPGWRSDSYGYANNLQWNNRLDQYNVGLRQRWREQADGLFEVRYAGGPFDPARYPDYQRSTFYSTTVVNGISNDASFTRDGDGTDRVHWTVATMAILAPRLRDALLRLPLRRR